MKKNIFLLSLTFLLIIPEILADKRAERGKCYISIGYVNDRAAVADFAKNSFIKPENFELFEREDKKVYLTLGKIDENLFKKLQSQNKTYDFNCSRGKGYEERLGLNSDFQIIGGNKINIVSAEQFISVVSSIEIEKQRLVDLEVEKQVQARLAAEKEKQRLAELERQRKAEADRLAAMEKAKQDEIDRLAAIENAKQKAEADRLAAIEKAKQDEIDRLAAIEKAKQDEIDRLAAIEKAKQAEILRKKQEAERERKAKIEEQRSLAAVKKIESAFFPFGTPKEDVPACEEHDGFNYGVKTRGVGFSDTYSTSIAQWCVRREEEGHLNFLYDFPYDNNGERSLQAIHINHIDFYMKDKGKIKPKDYHLVFEQKFGKGTKLSSKQRKYPAYVYGCKVHFIEDLWRFMTEEYRTLGFFSEVGVAFYRDVSKGESFGEFAPFYLKQGENSGPRPCAFVVDMGDDMIAQILIVDF